MRNNRKKLIVFDIIVLIILAGLFTLMQGGIIQGILALGAGAAVVAVALGVNIKTLALPSDNGKGYKQLDIVNGTADDAQAILKRYLNKDVVGTVAKTGISELNAAAKKRDALLTMISVKFPVGSVTYDKFASVVETAVATVTRNASILANRIQTFDANEYRRLQTAMVTGSYKRDNIPDDIQEEKARLYQKNRADMDAILAANESLLLELDRFTLEIGKIDANDSTTDSDAMVAEVKQLVEQLKYYD